MLHSLRFRAALVLLLTLPVMNLSAAMKAPANAPAEKDYTGVIVVDAGDGKVLFEDCADVPAYPASVTKLMNLLLAVEAIEAGKVRLDDRVTVTPEEAKMGGSQVYLKEGEVFTLEELLYATAIQSANDAALAVANHVGGDRDTFVQMMNQRATQLGMTHTKFTTPHGLASPKQEADLSTPRDIAALSREAVRHPLVLKFSSVKKRTFRQEPLLVMENHNKLLRDVPGCDGLKTGYLARGGYALAATVYRDGKRVIAVVMGSSGMYGRRRDAIARRLIASALPKASPAPASLTPQEPEPEMAVPLGAEAEPAVPVGAEEEGEPEDFAAETDDAAPAADEPPMVQFRLPKVK